MAEQSIRYQQQEEIKNLVNEFTKKPDLAWEAEDNEKIKIAEDFTNEYCQKLIEIFDKNSGFRRL